MKILVGIPCLFGYDHCKKAIDSVLNQNDVDLLLIDNGAEPKVKELIRYYSAFKIVNEKNIYVNPAWNQIIDFFLKSEHDYLIIMNSDLIMQRNWSEVLRNRWNVNPDEILLPVMGNSIPANVITDVAPAELVTSGTPGVFITLNRKQAEMIFPIPEACRVWFGDNWAYDILRTLGFETLIPSNLLAYHAWSQTVNKVKGISAIIEADKVAWRDIVEPKMRERINELLRGK
jgi:GT2 family glycosyltransferase